MKVISIDGNAIPVYYAVGLIELPIMQSLINAQVCKNLIEVSNQATRVYQVATLLTAPVVHVLGEILVGHVETLLAGAVKEELPLMRVLNKAHSSYRAKLDRCVNGTPPVLPNDFATRRLLLKDKLAILDIRVANVSIKVADMMVGHEDKPAVDAVLATLNVLRQSATENVGGSFGATQVALKELQLDYAEVESEGVRNGSLLAAEIELLIATMAADSLEAMISSSST